MENTKNLKIVFTGDTASVVAAFDAVQKKSAETNTKVKSFSSTLDDLGSSSKKLGGELSSLGGTMSRDFTLPIVGVGIAAAKMAMTFQQSMTYVRTDAGDTTDNIDQLSQSVLSLAKTSQFSPDQLANGLYHLASLGLRGADAMNALKTASDMAAVGGANLEDTTTALGAALVTGINGVQNYSEAAGTLDAIIGAGNMRMQDLIGALGSGILPVAKNAGLSLRDVGAALATLTDNGMGADESATRLRMTFALMEAPSKKAQGVLASLGMTATQMAMDMRTKGLVPALQDLKTHMLDTFGTTEEGKTKMAQALTEIFGGGRSSAAAQTLIDQLDRVGNKYDQIGTQSGEFANKVAEQQQTAAAKMKTAWSSVQADLIELGGKLLPTLAQDFTMLTGKIDEVTQWWDGLTKAQQKDIEKIGEVLVIGGPLLSFLGKLTSTFGTLLKLGGLGAGLFEKVFAGLGGAGAGAASLAGVGAEAGATTEAAAGLGALLTGPVGVALLGTAATATVAYLAYKKWTDDGVKPAAKSLSDFNNLANNLGVTVTGTGAKVNILTLAQIHEKDASNLVVAAGKAVDDTHKAMAASSATAAQKFNDVKDAQDKVTAAVKQYGAYSPQAQAAQDLLTQKQKDYNDALYATLPLSLQNTINEGNLTDAIKIHNGSVIDLTNTESFYNSALESTRGKIATLGPTALTQVASLQVLASNIGSVAGSWNGFVANFGQQNVDINAHLQGIGSTINRVQGQSNTLNASLGSASASASTLQGSMNGGGLQGGTGHNATGTNYFGGGLSWVGEKGPELVQLPRGSQVLNNADSQKVTNNRSVTIGTIVLASADAVKEMFNQLDRDNLLVSKGLSPARGM